MKKLFLVLMINISSLHSMVVEMPALVSEAELGLEEALDLAAKLDGYVQMETRLLELIETTEDEGVQDRARFALGKAYEEGHLGNQDREALETAEKHYLLACLLNVSTTIEKMEQRGACIRMGKYYAQKQLGDGTLEDDQQAVRYLEASGATLQLGIVGELYGSGRMQPRTTEGEIAEPTVEDLEYAVKCEHRVMAWCETIQEKLRKVIVRKGGEEAWVKFQAETNTDHDV